MKQIILTALVLIIRTHIFSQVLFSTVPKNKQLYPRDLVTNLGTVEIAGVVNSTGTPYTEVRVEVFRGTGLLTTLSQTLTYTGSIAPFSFSYEIPAELKQYKFKIYGYNGITLTLVRQVSNVVAGDAIIIQGQSNADAGGFSGSSSAYNSNFIRGYGSGYTTAWQKNWAYSSGDFWNATLGHAGQWGMVLAKNIVDAYGIPVAVINGAEGGQPVEYFQRNDANPTDVNTNYGKLLKRIKEAGLQNNIRAVFWYQGESNAFFMTTDMYKDYFTQLHTDWLADYPSIEQCYIFQIRKGCGQPITGTLRIQEAHRQLANDLVNIHVMSTNGAQHYIDDCHFPFAGGYEFDGQNIYRLAARDLYDAAEELNSEPPTVVSAELAALDQIVLTLENASDTYNWESGSENDFILYGTSVNIVSGLVSGNTIILNLSADATGITEISYVGHKGNSTPFPKNANGIGLLSFYKFPVDVLRLGDNSCNSTIKVYPNPADDHIHIQFEEIQNVVNTQIFSITGMLIKGQSDFETNTVSIDVHELEPGFYVIKFESEGEKEVHILSIE
ncbi:MAG: T9SS type A sorting domain-containing protein [Fimbriimonadaceae bacterium]|nr:T9SS type A sorting domain-containing protein [Chitinophagales bacterium]